MTNADSRRIAGMGARECAWCGEAEFQRENRTVCERCLNLLRNAGISDDDIFGPGPTTEKENERRKSVP